MVGHVQQETTMRKIILTLIGAALIAGSTSQMAFSKEHHHIRNTRQSYSERFRNANDYAAPYVLPKAGSGYSGGMGGWSSMTGFD
jgi:hypothetical protein